MNRRIAKAKTAYQRALEEYRLAIDSVFSDGTKVVVRMFNEDARPISNRSFRARDPVRYIFVDPENDPGPGYVWVMAQKWSQTPRRCKVENVHLWAS